MKQVKNNHRNQLAQNNNQSQPTPSKGYLVSILVFQQLLGSLAFPVAKYGLNQIEPFTFAFYRYVLSSIVLLVVVKLRSKGPPIIKKDFFKIVGLGCLIIPFNQTAYLFGQKYTAAGHGALLFATAPIWIFVGGLIYLRESFSFRRATGVILGLCGVGMIMATGALEIGTQYLMGDLIILMAVVAWGCYTILGKPLVIKYGAFRVTAYALAIGSALYFPFGLYRAIIFDYSKASMGAWFSIIYIALGLSVVAYVLWYWVLKYMEATKIAVFHNLQPVIASVVAYFFLNETIGWMFLVGGVIVLAGVFITES